MELGMLGKWIRERFEERVPPIRLLVLLHRLGYSLQHFPPKWISKMRIYRETLPPTEQRSFDQEFSPLIPHLNHRGLVAPTDRVFPHLGSPLSGIFKPFSKSKIWEIQQNFYKSTQLRAWRDVPYEISNNNLVRDLYLNQITQALDSFTRPMKLCIVEVGAGHGILSLLLAQELSRRKMEGSLVLCTDFHTSVFHSLINLPWYRAACEDGFLDFCECPAETCSNANRGLNMLFSGNLTSDPKFVWDLVVVIGNYAYDSFPVDLVYRSKGGALYEIGLVETSDGERAGGQKRSRDPINTSALQLMSPSREDSLKNQLLEEMIALPLKDTCNSADSGELQRFPDAVGAVLTVPVATTNLLMNVRQALNLSQRGRWMMIVGDSFLDPQDPRWQIENLENSAKNNFWSGSECVKISRWFDPPFISPRQEAVALPLSIGGMFAAFTRAFECRPVISAHSPLHSSDFVIITLLHTPASNSWEPSWRLMQSPSLSFGPNELCTLRQYFLSVNQDPIPVECFFEILDACGDDWIVTSQIFWKFRSTILSLIQNQKQEDEDDRASQLSLAFIRRSVAAFQSYVPTSFQEYFFHRWRLIAFLFSLSTIPHFPPNPFLLSCVFCLLTLHSPEAYVPSLMDSYLVIRTPLVVHYFQTLVPQMYAGGTEISVQLRLYSPLDFSLLLKCFVRLSAMDESTQLQSSIQLLPRPLADPLSFTSLIPRARTMKQDRKRWRKFCRKYGPFGEKE